MTVLPPHSPQRKAACHCSPNPHHPCAHTPAQTAKIKAASAKAKATNAMVTAKATAILRAHPPSRAQIAMAVLVAKNTAAYRKQIRKPPTKAQLATRRVAAWKAAQTRAKHAKTHPAHKRAGGTKPPAPLPNSFLLAAKKTVRAQLAAAAAAKIKHHRKARKATNPHTQALKRATTRKC